MSQVLDDAEIDHAVGHLSKSLAHGPRVLDTKGFLGSGSVERQIVAPVIRDLCSFGFANGGNLDDAVLGIILRDGVVREALPQNSTNLTHPEWMSDKNVTVTLGCI